MWRKFVVWLNRPVSRLPAIVLILATASAIMVMWNLQTSSLKNANTGSRYATVESLVDYGTFYIDNSIYNQTIDKVKVGKHYLSSKPPTLPTYAAGVYWLYQKITGKKISRYEGDVLWFVGLGTGWLGHVVFLLYFYRLLRLLLDNELAILTTMAAACFAWLGVGYATTLNNHSVGAALMTVGLFYVLRISCSEVDRKRDWVFAGLILGLLSAIDLPSTTLAGLSGIYLLFRNWRRALCLYAPALLPGLACHLGLSYLTTESLIPAYLNPKVKNYRGNYFKHVRTGIDALREPKLKYAFNVLLGHHGLFSMTPLFLFSGYEMVRRVVRKNDRSRELYLVVATAAIITAFYIFRTHNYGGWCVGMRWLVPIMPLFLLYFGLWLDRVKPGRLLWCAVVLSFGVSTFNVQDALGSPFQFSRWHNWLEHAPNRNRQADKLNLPRRAKKPHAAKRRKGKRSTE